jgi:uncharacterized protein YndB with AHSA1/START domain
MTMTDDATVATPGGAPDSDAERVIERKLELSASVERVWRALTDAGELSKWFGDETRLVLEPGAEGAMIWNEHGSYAVRVEVVEAPVRFVWRWVHEPDVPFDAAPSTRVEWTLERRDDGGTTLRLRESGFRTDSHFRQNTEGWREELAELVAVLSR